MRDLKAIRFIEGTKISHDYEENNVTTFSYRDLWEKKVPAIGIPCKQNGIFVIDVDVPGLEHKEDGREFWHNFCIEYGIPQTYTVTSRSGGFHFYFKLPEAINPDTFSPPGRLAPGVDLKWNGWVGAPPSKGYGVYWGALQDIQIAPPSLMAYISELVQGKPQKTFDVTDPNMVLELARPFSHQQLVELDQKLHWMQLNATLSRDEWRNGLFALKAGIEDTDKLYEYAGRWTRNRSFVNGDEEEAIKIVDRASKYGGIKPGTIFAIINECMRREGAPIPTASMNQQIILDKAKVVAYANQKGKMVVEPSESNAAAIIGAMFDEKDLYHDVRTDLFIFKGKSYSDAQLINIFLPLIQSPTFGLGLEKIKKQSVSVGLDVLMQSRQKDPHKDFLTELHWDGVPRLEKFFSEYVGAEDSEYTRLVGLNFWTALAARGLQPGCKFDSMVILEGHEGIMKSSLVEAIGGHYTYAPAKRDTFDDLDVLRQMHQSIIVELPELRGLIGASAETVKAFLSKPFDNIRAMFAKRAMTHPRGFVFVGTTNSDKYLPVAMGVRRFWPIRIIKGNKVNIDAVKADRDQLFAEGVARFKDGYKYWTMPEELLDKEVSTRVMEEPLTPIIKEMLPSFGERIGVAFVYQRLEAAGILPRGVNPAIIQRIETGLKKSGCIRNSDGSWSPKETLILNTFSSIINADSLI